MYFRVSGLAPGPEGRSPYPPSAIHLHAIVTVTAADHLAQRRQASAPKIRGKNWLSRALGAHKQL